MTDVVPGIYDNRHTMRREYWERDRHGAVRPVAAVSHAASRSTGLGTVFDGDPFGSYPNIPNTARRRKWPC